MPQGQHHNQPESESDSDYSTDMPRTESGNIPLHGPRGGPRRGGPRTRGGARTRGGQGLAKHRPPAQRSPQSSDWEDLLLAMQETPCHHKAMFQNWTNVSLAEIKGFIAIILNMGIDQKPSIESYWFTSSSQCYSWFSKMFTRNRFQLLFKFFHIIDPNILAPPSSQKKFKNCRWKDSE